jgi:hypothetical protein
LINGNGTRERRQLPRFFRPRSRNGAPGGAYGAVAKNGWLCPLTRQAPQLASAHPTWLVALMAPAAFVLASCVSFDRVDYPKGWGGSAAALLANGCPDLSGTYDTRPTDAYPAGLATSPTLNEILGPGGLSDVYGRDKPWPALPGATTATLTSDGDWLYVHFRDDAGGVADLKFKRKHWWGGTIDGADAMYHCQKLEQEAVLGIDGSRRPSFAVPYSFHASDVAFVFLSKGWDGSLIVSYRTARVGIERSLVGSYAGWVGGVWWRYTPVAPKR